MPPMKYKDMPPVGRHGEALQADGILQYRQRFMQASLEMEVVWRGCSTLGAIVNDEIARQSGRQIEHIFQLAADPLGAVLSVSYRDVMVNDWEWIAIDPEVPGELQPFLLRKEIFGAEEAWTVRDRFRINRCGRASRAMRNMAD